MVLENGMVFCVNRVAEPASQCNLWSEFVCARIHMDINGAKAPNQYSRDDFWWVVTSDDKVLPYDKGYLKPEPHEINCWFTEYASTRQGGVSWILMNGNMDYIRKKT